jgi:uncharacterized protein (TIGR03083 family)
VTGAERGPALPAGLRERVMAASLEARAAGRSDPAPPEISPVEAFIRTADAFHGTLGLLSGAQWQTPALRDLDVQGLVGHLTGVEEDVHRGLAGDPGVSAADHVASTQPAADRQAGRPPDRTRAEWRRAADQTIDLVRTADLGARVAVHGIQVSLGLLLIIRAFELWVHEDDIRTAVGLPLSVPDPSVLALMTSAAAGLLPYAAAGAGLEDPVRVHLVLTGPGGGTWDVAVGQGPSDPAAVMIVADAVAFCRLAANRITPAGLGAHVTGDADRAAAVLAAAATLALD